jgi:hypothetical protein
MYKMLLYGIVTLNQQLLKKVSYIKLKICGFHKKKGYKFSVEKTSLVVGMMVLDVPCRGHEINLHMH